MSIKGRTPAYCAIYCKEGSTISGVISGNNSGLGTPELVPDNIVKTLKKQVVALGNRIGHNPKAPKTFISPENHKRPPSLLEVIGSFTDSYFKTKLYKTLYHHLDKSGNSIRQIRSEFREMISMGCSLLTHYYDVMSGEIGFRNDSGQFVRLSYEQLANKLNVSIQRLKRFFTFLKDRNLIRILEDKKKDENGI